MFEKASRLGLKFETCQGVLSVEDLWTLPLTSARRANLNEIAIGLHRQLENSTVSFVDDDQRPDEKTQLRFDIVKHIIGVKKAENAAALDASARAERKQKLLGVLARKQDAALESMSQEEIEALINAT